MEALTGRERQVLVHVARGQTLEEVASRLGMSRNTAQTHLERVYDKLAVSTPTAAALSAVRLGLVRL